MVSRRPGFYPRAKEGVSASGHDSIIAPVFSSRGLVDEPLKAWRLLQYTLVAKAAVGATAERLSAWMTTCAGLVPLGRAGLVSVEQMCRLPLHVPTGPFWEIRQAGYFWMGPLFCPSYTYFD